MTTVYDAPHDEIDEPRYWGPSRIGLSVVVIAIIAMWIWIYFFAPRNNPDRLETRAFATDAEAVCAPAQALLDEIPLGSTVSTPQARAEQVIAGTDITIDMVADLRRVAAQVTDESDLEIISAWLDDWDVYIGDRQAHIVKLSEAAPDASPRDLAFTLSAIGEGGIYTRRIDGLANVNDMASCVVPGDI